MSTIAFYQFGLISVAIQSQITTIDLKCHLITDRTTMRNQNLMYWQRQCAATR